MAQTIDLSLYRNKSPFTTKSSALSALKTQLSNAKDGVVVLVRYYAVDGNTNSEIKTIFGFSYNNASKKYYSIYDLDEVTNICKKYTDQAIDNIKIGGQNLLLNSSLKSNKYWSNSNSAVGKYIQYTTLNDIECVKYLSGCSGGLYQYITSDRINSPHTVSIDVYTDTLTSISLAIGPGKEAAYKNFEVTPKQWTRIHVTYPSITSNKQAIIIYVRRLASELYFKNIKLEQGNMPTAWSPSPEDKQDTLISGTNIKTINGQSILANGNIDLGVSNLYTSSVAYSESSCIEYCTRKGPVSWPQSDLVEPKGDAWKVGNFIFLALKCTTGDTYMGYQKIVSENQLLPISYFIIKRGIQGKTGPQGPQGPGLPLVQTTGVSTTSAMSQKAVTDALKNIDGGTF